MKSPVPEELVRLRRAAEISEQAAMEGFSMARPGLPISELVNHYRTRVAQLGADFDHYEFCVGGQGISSDTDHHLRENETLFVDFACNYTHYLSDSGTTLSLGEPSPELLRRYEALRDCVTAAEESLAPGVRASTVR